jgi:hypothetical protein
MYEKIVLISGMTNARVFLPTYAFVLSAFKKQKARLNDSRAFVFRKDLIFCFYVFFNTILSRRPDNILALSNSRAKLW